MARIIRMVLMGLCGVGLWWLALGSGAAQPAEAPTQLWRVCPAGPPACDVASPQAAVDAAAPGDTILIMEGRYADLHQRARPADYLGAEMLGQLLFVDKPLTLRGGYDAAFTEPPDPIRRPTILDAEGRGRVLFVAHPDVTVEGVTLRGGEARGQGGEPAGLNVAQPPVLTTHRYPTACVDAPASDPAPTYDLSQGGMDFGGALYLHAGASLTLRGVTVEGSRADWGGGVANVNGQLTLERSTIAGNRAAVGGGFYAVGGRTEGRGLHLIENGADQGAGGMSFYSTLALADSAITGNAASDWGGGLLLWGSESDIRDSRVQDNQARQSGGLYASYGALSLAGSEVANNRATEAGGGIHLRLTDLTLQDNRLTGNQAQTGGGVLLERVPHVEARHNQIVGNEAEVGGGIYLLNTPGTWKGSTIAGNRASYGGGLYLASSAATFINSMVVDNVASAGGSGLMVDRGAPIFWHTTLAHHEPQAGSAILLCGLTGRTSHLQMTNSILTQHEVALQGDPFSSMRLEATLWGDETGATIRAQGGTLDSLRDLWGDPAFVDPAAGDYHLGLTSAAIDEGIAAGVSEDIDGQQRAVGPRSDLGADEMVPHRLYLPLVH